MNISPDKIQKKNGFTLVEVLMAMIILMFGILAVASMQIMAMRGNQHARETTMRTTTADNIMEWLVSLNFDHNNLRDEHDDSDDIDKHTVTIPDTGAPTINPTDDVLPPSNLIPPPGQARNRITSVDWVVHIQTPTSFTTGDEITSKRIEVTVNWEGGGSTQISNIRNQI